MYRWTLAAMLAGAVFVGSFIVSAPVAADPPPWAGVWKHKHKHHYQPHDDYRVVYVPVPAVRETRIIHHRAAPVAQGLPYGFNRGTCDRGLVSSEMVGSVLGGAAGGVAGNQFGKGQGKTAATIGGTILGVLVGGSIGRTMDSVDQGCVAGMLDHVPDSRAIAWAGDDGQSYRVVPVRSYEARGQYCREYQATAVVGGRQQQTYGTACRMPDGQWRIVD